MNTYEELARYFLESLASSVFWLVFGYVCTALAIELGGTP